MADDQKVDNSSWRRIPIVDENGNPQQLPVPPDMPKAQLHAIMRDQGWQHNPSGAPATTSTSTSPTPEPQPGVLGSAWEAAKDEAINPFLQSVAGVSRLTSPSGLSESLGRARQHPFQEALTQGGNVAGVVAPFLAPEATAAQVGVHALTRALGASRGTAQTAGTVAGLAAPGARVLYEGTNVPGQLTRLGHESVDEYHAARGATQNVLNGVVTEADNRGITMNPTQRQALASEIDDLYPTRGQIPTIDRLETHLLDPHQDVTMSDLDRYHTDVRKKLPMSPTYNQAQDQALQATIRKAQEDLLQPHGDLHGPWTGALDQWGREISPSRALVGKVARNQSTIESRATSDLFEANQRAPGGALGVPAVNDRLRQARDLFRAQQRSAGPAMTVAAPLIGAAVGGGGAAGSQIAGGERDPATIAATVIPAAIASAIATQGLRTGRVGLATPAGRAAASHYLAVAPAAAQRMTTAQPDMLAQIISAFSR